jgi:hypothetical protein
MGNKSKNKRKAPYVSAAALSQFLDHIRYVSTPKKVDAGLLRDYGISKGNVFALISALKFLGLIDDGGKPTPAFSSLQVMGEEFVSNLREIVNTAYADLFARLDVSDKATVLFLDLCKEAGIPVTAEGETRGVKVSTPRPVKKQSEHPERVTPAVKDEAEAPLTDDELKRIYVRKLVDQISPPDTAGKDADAVKAEMELRKAELDRIEKLIGINKEKEIK